MVKGDAAIDALTVQQIDTVLAGLTRLTHVSLRLPYPEELHRMRAVVRSPSLPSPVIIASRKPSRFIHTSLRPLVLDDVPLPSASHDLITAFGPDSEALCVRSQVRRHDNPATPPRSSTCTLSR